MPYESHYEMADRLADALARLRRARDEGMELQREVEQYRAENARLRKALGREDDP